MTSQPRKRLMLFSLTLQRINRQNALSTDSAKKKLEKKAVFSLRCGDEATYCYFSFYLIRFSPHCGDEATPHYNKAKFFLCGAPTLRQYAVNRLALQ